MVERTKLSAREFLQLPETNTLVELIEGEIIVSPAPTDDHQRVLGKTFLVLIPVIPGGQIRFSPTDVVLDEGNVVQPDCFWVSPTNTRCFLGPDRRWHGPPDLVIEVFSPGTARRDRGIKFELYQRHGVIEYWMEDIEAQYVEVWLRDGDRLKRQGVYGPGESFVSAVLGGRSIDVNALLDLPSTDA